MRAVQPVPSAMSFVRGGYCKIKSCRLLSQECLEFKFLSNSARDTLSWDPNSGSLRSISETKLVAAQAVVSR